MRSRDAARFNHDAEAARYDVDVADESHLIRRGYSACLRALAEDLRRGSGPDTLPIVELGAGTGALTAQMPPGRPVIAVDISGAMLDQARAKLRGAIEFVQDDLLAWITEQDGPLGTVASTFALHHLHPDEKRLLIDTLAERMQPGARLCVGDLGFANADAQSQMMADPHLDPGVTEAVAVEYFWHWDDAEAQLRGYGFRVRRRQHGPLISSLVAVR